MISALLKITIGICSLSTINTEYDMCLNELFNYDVRFQCHRDRPYTRELINQSTDVHPSEELRANNVEPPIAPFEDWAKLKIQEQGEKLPISTNVESTVKAIRNYAGKECGAKILEASLETQNPSAVLNDKELDEYMLNPCGSDVAKWFVVELCETVQIGRFEMANFELFSCRPKDFKIWISDRYPHPDWVLVGQFLAEDKREIHMFSIEHRRLYAKYLKLELVSHYGGEHFSSLTFIRVLGVSMAEEYENDAVSSLLSAEHNSNLSSNQSAAMGHVTRSSVDNSVDVTTTASPVDGGNRYLQDAKSAMLSAARQFYGKVFNVETENRSLLNLTHNKGCRNKTAKLKEKKGWSFEACRQCPVNNVSRLWCVFHPSPQVDPPWKAPDRVKDRVPIDDATASPSVVLATPVENASTTRSRAVLVGMMGGHRESVFARINQRIRALELNVSLSSQYLSELSRRYTRQMQHVERAFNATSRLFNETDHKFQLRLDQQASDLLSLADRLAKLEHVLANFLASAHCVPESCWQHFWCAVAVIANLVIVAVCRRAVVSRQEELVVRLRAEFRAALQSVGQQLPKQAHLLNNVSVSGSSDGNVTRIREDKKKKKKWRPQSVNVECIGEPG